MADRRDGAVVLYFGCAWECVIGGAGKWIFGEKDGVPGRIAAGGEDRGGSFGACFFHRCDVFDVFGVWLYAHGVQPAAFVLFAGDELSDTGDFLADVSADSVPA